MPGRPLLVVRTDGGPGVGVGHLARCLALVQAWTDRGGEAALATRGAPTFWADQFLLEGCSVIEPGAAPEVASWRVEDGYHLVTADRAGQVGRTLVIDDHDNRGTGGEGADLVLDQNLGADAGRYPKAAGSLLGPRYALLRRAIRDAPARPSVPPIGRRLVVVLGGSPSHEARALAAAVASAPRLRDLEIRVLDGVQDSAGAMQEADLAVAAAGTVSWELCRAGVPSVLVAVAPNQVPLAEHLSAHGAAVHVAPEVAPVVDALLALSADAPARVTMSRIGQSLVDGRGARRVVCRLRSELLTLADVGLEHAGILLTWSNDAATRAASFSTAPISAEEHRSWLAARLDRPSSASYLARDPSGALVGFVRFDADEAGGAEIGVTVAPDRRGQGWGGALVDAGSRHWALARGPGKILAQIKATNPGSVAAFVDADFDEVASVDDDVFRYARSFDGDQRRS